MATHSSILAWKIPWTEESGSLQSMGSQRVRQNWACTHTHTPCHPTPPTHTRTHSAWEYCSGMGSKFHLPLISPPQDLSQESRAGLQGWGWEDEFDGIGMTALAVLTSCKKVEWRERFQDLGREVSPHWASQQLVEETWGKVCFSLRGLTFWVPSYLAPTWPCFLLAQIQAKNTFAGATTVVPCKAFFSPPKF